MERPRTEGWEVAEYGMYQRFVLPGNRRAYLVLDSTELTRDWLLRGLDFRVLRHLREDHFLYIVVPSVVVEEVEANHRRALEELQRSEAKLRKQRRRLGISQEAGGESSLDEPYAEQLSRALELLRAEVLPWPDKAHQEVAARAVARIPPFGPSGSGYRDTLVWLSALGCARAGDRVYLASTDRAFAGPGGSLAVSLAEEAAALGLDVRLVADLRRWVVEQLPWRSELSLPQIAAEVRDERFATYLAESDVLWDLEEIDADDMGLPPSTRELVVLEVRPAYDLRTVGVRSASVDEVLVEYEMTADIQLEAEMDVSDAEAAGIDHEMPNYAGRVMVRADIPAVIRIGVYYDEYDEEAGWAYLQVQARGRHGRHDPPPDGSIQLTL